MKNQKKSRTLALGGALGRGQALGEIFFPTDGASLSTDDLIVVNAIALMVRAQAIKKRVELVVHGFADHRGPSQYNKSLGQRRATVVQRKLSNLLRGTPNVSTITALSSGESFAVQGSTAANQLASDRRVVVWDNIPEFWKESRKRPKIEKVPRLTFLRLHDFDGSVSVRHPNVRQGHENTAKLVQYGVDYLTAGPFDEYGTPTEATYVPMDGSYRVSDVYIFVKTNSKIGITADTIATDTQIRYIWGPPSPKVVIRKSVFARRGGDDSRARNERKVISRREADSDPFTFPLGRINL